MMLRIILIVMMVGGVLTAWFLLRGYSRKDDGEPGMVACPGGSRTVPAPGTAESA
ncbi:hypothetical protein HTV45_26440 [Streptomyces sp. CHD11]|uniref:hypothetical protein n=1 Tax=Streptomyces sp. CHD11 TaxID=2741325 RepID=UPI001BFC29C7|nr:hypothetical protein [Streptomyces sp. CHD11]MBT3154369.1 hypothetical protein [Streptomyces sp. CHD11]